MGSVIIDAGHNSSGVREFILLEETIQSLLNDFFVSEGLCQHKQDGHEQKSLAHLEIYDQ